MKVYLLDGNPQAIFAGIAAATRKQESPAELVEYYEAHPKRAETMCKKLKRLGHYSVFELEKAIVFEDVSRLFTFLTWIAIRPEYGVNLGGLEKSLRETKALSALKEDSITKEAFELYNYMIEKGVPKEDARYVLPASTLTWVAIKYDTRYLSKLLSYYRSFGLEELTDAANELERLLIFNTEEKPLHAYTFNDEPMGEEVFNKYFFRCKIEGSMSMWHQLIRNRLVNVELEGLLHARKHPLVIPYSFRTHDVEEEAIALWEKAKESDDIYHFLLGQKLYGYISGTTSALDWFCQYRCCLRAQWEIFRIAWKMREEGSKLGLNLGPRCFKLGYCPEDEVECPFFGRHNKKVARIQH